MGKKSTIALCALGFGLYRAAASYFYNTAMGTVPSGVGFVSTLEFVLALNLTSLLVAIVILFMLRKGVLHARGVSQTPALLAVILGLALNWSGVLSSFPEDVSMIVSGVLCGVALMLLSAVWLEVFVAQSDPIHALVQIVAGFVIYGFLYIGLSLLPMVTASICSLCILIVSTLIVVILRRGFPESMEQKRPDKSMLRTDSLSVFINFFVLVGVVGILHTSVLGSSSEHIVGAVSMRGSILWATAIVVLIAIILGQKINPTTVFKVCFSFVIVIFSLLPFFGSASGPFTGTFIIICYNVCGMVFFLFLVRESRRLQVSGYLMASIYMIGSNVFLLFGLGIGLGLSALSAGYNLSLLTLLAFAAIYPLAIGLMTLMRRTKRLPDTESSKRAPAVHTDSESAFNHATTAIAQKFALTKREREIFGYLARGRSARFIAETLIISENTTWTHIKRIYSKMNIHTKQELMSIMEQEMAHPLDIGQSSSE